MARAAFQLAMSSEKITADVFEAQEFPELAQRYQVRGVPMTLVNEGEPHHGQRRRRAPACRPCSLRAQAAHSSPFHITTRPRRRATRSGTPRSM